MTDARLAVEFLTMEEVRAVDAALLSAADKFSTRLAIYACRALREISRITGERMDQISAEAIADWIAHDPQMENLIDMDQNFIDFFVRLVTAALVPLNQMALSRGVTLEDLSVEDIIAWFEHSCRLES